MGASQNPIAKSYYCNALLAGHHSVGVLVGALRP